jgi:hypothetical protein
MITRPRRPFVLSAAAMSLAVAALAPSNAHAEELYLTPGITVSTSLDSFGSTWAFGVECSLTRRYEGLITVGGVAQAQVLTDGTLRFAVGAEGSALGLGAELGVALRTGNARRSFALSLYAAPFASIGYAYGAYEFNFVLGSPRQVPALERFARFGLKLPLQSMDRYELVPGDLDRSVQGHEWEVADPFRYVGLYSQH